MSFFKRLLGKDQEMGNEETTTEDVNISEVNYFDDSELIAVISAAVATMMNGSVGDINIQTIRRLPVNTIAWADMGRKEQMLGNL